MAYWLVSGAGWGYQIGVWRSGVGVRLLRERDDATVWLQGDDAVRLLEEFEQSVEPDMVDPPVGPALTLYEQKLAELCGPYFNT